MRITTYSLKLNVVEKSVAEKQKRYCCFLPKIYMTCWMIIPTMHFQKKSDFFMESPDCCIVFCFSFYCDQICMHSIILFVSPKIWKRNMHLSHKKRCTQFFNNFNLTLEKVPLDFYLNCESRLSCNSCIV